MWAYLSLFSALFLGIYDILKKKSLEKNGVMTVLFSISVLSTLILSPFFSRCDAGGILLLVPKAALVTLSWISGLEGMKRLPLTTASTIKASRPVFVVIFSILLFGERLSVWQWAGVVLSLSAIWMLSRSSRREGIFFSSDKGVAWMAVSVVAGVASALYDKKVMQSLDPLSVLSWSNLLVTGMMGMVLLAQILRRQKKADAPSEPFRFDWHLLATAVLIVAADWLYFQALAQDGAMLSVISLMRRGSVIVTFSLSAIVFRERNVKRKAAALAVLLTGMTVLLLASG